MRVQTIRLHINTTRTCARPQAQRTYHEEELISAARSLERLFSLVKDAQQQQQLATRGSATVSDLDAAIAAALASHSAVASAPAAPGSSGPTTSAGTTLSDLVRRGSLASHLRLLPAQASEPPALATHKAPAPLQRRPHVPRGGQTVRSLQQAFDAQPPPAGSTAGSAPSPSELEAALSAALAAAAAQQLRTRPEEAEAEAEAAGAEEGAGTGRPELLRRGSLASHLRVLPAHAPAPPPLQPHRREHGQGLPHRQGYEDADTDGEVVRALQATFDQLLLARQQMAEEGAEPADAGAPATQAVHRGAGSSPLTSELASAAAAAATLPSLLTECYTGNRHDASPDTYDDVMEDVERVRALHPRDQLALLRLMHERRAMQHQQGVLPDTHWASVSTTHTHTSSGGAVQNLAARFLTASQSPPAAAAAGVYPTVHAGGPDMTSMQAPASTLVGTYSAFAPGAAGSSVVIGYPAVTNNDHEAVAHVRGGPSFPMASSPPPPAAALSPPGSAARPAGAASGFAAAAATLPPFSPEAVAVKVRAFEKAVARMAELATSGPDCVSAAAAASTPSPPLPRTSSMAPDSPTKKPHPHSLTAVRLGWGRYSCKRMG